MTCSTVIPAPVLPAEPVTSLEGTAPAVCPPATQASEAAQPPAIPAAQPSAPASAIAGPVELDMSQIARPEQFFANGVAGLAVPVTLRGASGPEARWFLYHRRSDGRRECGELPSYLDLPDGSVLWLHPMPAEPAPGTRPAWSGRGRQAWLRYRPAPDPVKLFNRICSCVDYFLDFPPEVAADVTATIALWIMRTYSFQACAAMPYLFATGLKSSGKTTLLGILNRLVFRPFYASNVTAPVIFRTLHDQGGVLLLDEAEQLNGGSPEVDQINSMLLAGYKQGGKAARLTPVGEQWRMIQFDVFGPKAVACINDVPPTLVSRCIPIRMRQAESNSPKPKRRLDSLPHAWVSLRDGLHAFSLEHGEVWRELSAWRGAPAGINGRPFELWQPLLSLASWLDERGAAGLSERMQRYALAIIAESKDESNAEDDEILLQILAESVRRHRPCTPGEILVEAQKQAPTVFDKTWKPQRVASRLRHYELKTAPSNGRRVYRPAMRDLLAIQQRYRIDLGIQTPEAPDQKPILVDPVDPATTPEDQAVPQDEVTLTTP